MPGCAACGHHLACADHRSAVGGAILSGPERGGELPVARCVEVAACRAQCVLVSSRPEICTPEAQVVRGPVRPAGEQLLEDGDGLAVAAQVVELPAVEASVEVVQRVQLQRTLHLAIPVVGSVQSRQQEIGIEEAGVRQVRICGDRLPGIRVRPPPSPTRWPADFPAARAGRRGRRRVPAPSPCTLSQREASRSADGNRRLRASSRRCPGPRTPAHTSGSFSSANWK